MDREGAIGECRDLCPSEEEACGELRATLANNLKAARGELKLSQAAFARMAGVKQNTLCNLENGHQNASMPMLARLASAIGVTVPALLIPGAVLAGGVQATAPAPQGS